MPSIKTGKPRCFLAIPHSNIYGGIRDAIQAGAQQAGYQVVSLDQSPVMPGGSIQEAIIGELARADCIVADVSDRNPNIFFELGLAQAMGKGIIILVSEQKIRETPFDIREFRAITYSEDNITLSKLSDKISRSLREFRKFPRQRKLVNYAPYSTPFFVDWDRLSSREIENLCQELLAQMGFRRLAWGKLSPELDLVAELPKKDPDGFEYRELWLVSMALRMPIEECFDLFSEDPDYLLHRLTKYSNNNDEFSFKRFEAPITFLLIQVHKNIDDNEIQSAKERFEKRRFRSKTFSSNLRLRIWDREYLTSIIQRFPSVGYKYFSDEGRIRSKSRKSYEDLYLENTHLSARQAKLISDLEEEKNKRARAERDAIWKDISFSAAHKIGNPIFAIETDLEPLSKRIRENREEEALQVVKNIKSAVEKAKAFVGQFKSLAKAQEISLIPTLLRPILEDACNVATKQGVKCRIDCPEDLAVQGDPDRLAECFDELVMNATHWLNKPEKMIQIVVVNPAPEPLPSTLDTSKKYLVVHVKDNGDGVIPSEKSRIFDAFYTKYEHGTGLGLALVRRILDGHGGGITESGPPGKGADFEAYLPLKEQTVSR